MYARPRLRIASFLGTGREASSRAKATPALLARWSSAPRACWYWSNCRTPNPATAAHVLQAFSDKFNAIASPMRQSLTYDRGGEMAEHQQLTRHTGMKVYFCDLYSPWQRGSNENTNGLLRQCFPRILDVSGYAQEQLDVVPGELNGLPRIPLGDCTPFEVHALTWSG